MPTFARATTESQLRDWHSGQVEAERLAAAILNLDGFTEIDPQSPQGGPDGQKDILCSKNLMRFVCGVYVPTTDVTFPTVKRKFIDDLKGAVRHNRKGFIFITNQKISLKGRSSLEKIASEIGKTAMLYHRERIRVLLDSPAGYGVRIESLGIPMNESEQLAYFAYSNNRLENALKRQIEEIQKLAQRVGKLQTSQKYVAQTMHAMATQLSGVVSLPPRSPLLNESTLSKFEANLGPISATVTPSLLSFIHRIVCTEIPFSYLGRFRDRKVWLGGPGTTEESAKLIPPKPDEIPAHLEEILGDWNRIFPELQSSNSEEKLIEIARFHQKILTLHPFLDGNGRVARTMLVQQCIDLFGHIDSVLLDSGAPYYSALRKADEGDYKLLCELIFLAVNQ